jgi:hypothetical protein
VNSSVQRRLYCSALCTTGQKSCGNFCYSLASKTKKGEYSERYMFGCTVSPGRESSEEAIATEERSGLLSEIADWLGRLHEDVVSAPVARQFAEHENALKKMRERLDQLPDEPLVWRRTSRRSRRSC